MESLPADGKRRCINGPRCYHVTDLGSDQPQEIPTARKEPICYRCESNYICPPDELDGALVQEKHERLLRAANILLDNGVTGEEKIIPTLVFAAISDMDPAYGHVGDALMEAYGQSADDWEDIHRGFALAFKGIEPCAPVAGVPVVLRLPVAISLVPDTTDWYVPDKGDRLFTEAAVIVYDGKTEPRVVAQEYEKVLRLFSLPHAPKKGGIECNSEGVYFMFLARPNIEPPNHRNPNILLPPEGPPLKRQPPFPDPAYVAAVYAAYQKRGWVPVARKSGKTPELGNLVPAVVAWYLGGRHKNLDDNARKSEVTRLVKKLLPDWAKQAEKDKQRQALWRSLKAIQSQIWLAEGAITAGTGRLHTFF